MQQSTPETPIPKQAPSILMIGPPGQGKTTLAMQFPGVYIAMCDPKTQQGPIELLRKQNPQFSFHYDLIWSDDGEVALDPAKAWVKLVTKLKEAILSPDIKTVVIDSLTAIDEMLTRYIMFQQKRTAMEIQDWRTFVGEMKGLMMTLRATGKTSIVTAHEKPDYDKEGKVISYKVVLSSSLSDYFGWIFTDVWRIYSLPGPAGKQKYCARFLSDGNSKLHNSLTIDGSPAKPAVMEDVTFDKLNAYLKLV